MKNFSLCDFYKELDILLKQYDKHITTNEDKAKLDFENWLTNKTNKENANLKKAIKDWFIQEHINTNRDLFGNGYNSIMTGYVKNKYCNIVKEVCNELGITQKELAERLGVNDGTIRKWATQTEPPGWGVKFLELLLENKKIKEKYELFKKAFEMIEKARG